jgi:enoyl-CoA hydratase
MAITDHETISINYIDDEIILCTLKRPEVSNAFNSIMAKEIYTFLEDFSIGNKKARIIILTGHGKKAFCAGGDLKERNKMTTEEWFIQHKLYERMMRAIKDCPIPIIAAVNGAAYGGGCEIVSAVDFAYAAKHSLFAQTETKLGIIPGAGGTQNLPRAIGEKRALELILTGKTFTALEAKNWGLVNEVFDGDQLMIEVTKIAKKIAKNAPLAVKQAKNSIKKGLNMSLSDGLFFEIECYNRTIPTKDRLEGILAFNEKRPPKFEGH